MKNMSFYTIRRFAFKEEKTELLRFTPAALVALDAQ